MVLIFDSFSPSLHYVLPFLLLCSLSLLPSSVPSFPSFSSFLSLPFLLTLRTFPSIALTFSLYLPVPDLTNPSPP